MNKEKELKYFLINLSENSKEIQLPEKKKITIGRAMDNTIRISNAHMLVSRYHGEIFIENGKCIYKDLYDNMNGSYHMKYDDYANGSHNWTSVPKGGKTQLYRDYVIRLGGKKSKELKGKDAKVCDLKIVVKEITEAGTTTTIEAETTTDEEDDEQSEIKNKKLWPFKHWQKEKR